MPNNDIENNDKNVLDKLIDGSLDCLTEDDITHIYTNLKLPNLEILSMPSLTYANEINLPSADTINLPRLSQCDTFVAPNARNIIIDNLRTVGAYSFQLNNITYVYLPFLDELSSNCFLNCSQLETVYLDRMHSMGNSNFQQCPLLETVNVQNLTSMGSTNFTNCANLEVISMPNLQTCGNNNFYGSGYTSVDFPNLEIAGDDFLKSTTLTSANLNKLKTAGMSFLYNCQNLTSVQLDSLEQCGSSSFNYSGLINVNLKSIQNISSSCFCYCSDLESVETGTSTVTFGDNLFNNSPKMKSLIINSTQISTLNGALKGSFANGEGTIYVPANLVDAYKADVNWGTYNIESIEVYLWRKLYNSLDSGTYMEEYTLGDEIPYTTTDGKQYHAQIVGFDKDVGTNNKTIAVTFINKETTDNNYQMNTTESNDGGWGSSAMRTSTMPAIKATLPQYITSRITTAKKYSYNSTTDANQTTNDDVWIPSMYELRGSGDENTGANYRTFFGYNTDKKNLSGTRSSYWTRTALEDDDENFYYIDRDGDSDDNSASSRYSIVFGFCIGVN